MSEKEKGASLIKTALVVSVMTGAVCAGGFYVVTKVLDQPAEVVREIPPPPMPPVIAPEKTQNEEKIETVGTEVPAEAMQQEPEPEPDLEQAIASPDQPAAPAEEPAALEQNPLATAAGDALIERLRAENDLRPAGTDARQWAAERLGYVPAATDPQTSGEDEPIAPQEEAALPIGDEGVSGVVSVYAPGHLLIDGRSVAISGIITPAISDLCTSAAGESFSCGSWALGAWTTGVNGREAHCLALSDAEEGDNRARCEIIVNGVPLDIGAWAVKAGAALADQDNDIRYLAEETEARQEGRGLWAVNFMIDGVENEVAPAREADSFLHKVPEALPADMIEPPADVPGVIDDAVEAIEEGAVTTTDALEEVVEEIGAAGEAVTSGLEDVASEVAADLETTINDIAERAEEAFEDVVPADEDEGDGDVPAAEAAQ